MKVIGIIVVSLALTWGMIQFDKWWNVRFNNMQELTETWKSVNGYNVDDLHGWEVVDEEVIE